MIRRAVTAAAVAASAVAASALSLAPVAAAEPAHYDGDVPGLNTDASAGAPCDSWDRFIFGRGDDGQALACHWIPNQWPPIDTGFWVISYPLYGVQDIGTPCPDPRGAAAQSPDGIALVCKGSQGWQPAP